jgi:NADPH2:quinone reductase
MMKMVVSKEGKVQISNYPLPKIEPNSVLIKTEYSAISPGTEMMMQRNSSKEPVALGYSAVGIVEEIGSRISHVKAGQRVACYGGPYVRHAEYLTVPRQLVVPLPENADPKEGAFVGLGAIAIHALRQADLRFGENVVILGLGILGQIAAQIANAASFNVLSCDLIEERCKKLEETGVVNVCRSISELEEQIEVVTNGAGVDSVFVLCRRRL